jgi:hypothetical protein
MEDTPEDATTGHAIDHIEYEASCFPRIAYVQRIIRNAIVFTQDKPSRPPRTKEQWQGTEGQHAPSEEPATYPPAAHIPVPIDIKQALSGKHVAEWRQAIRSELASLHNKGTSRMKNLQLGHNAIGNKWVFKIKAKPDGTVDRFKARSNLQSTGRSRLLGDVLSCRQAQHHAYSHGRRCQAEHTHALGRQ